MAQTARKRSEMAQTARKRSEMAQTKKLKITLVKSTIGFDKKQDKVVTGLGLRRIGHTIELADTPETRGMLLKVRHLVTVEGN